MGSFVVGVLFLPFPLSGRRETFPCDGCSPDVSGVTVLLTLKFFIYFLFIYIANEVIEWRKRLTCFPTRSPGPVSVLYTPE